jgi:hypothetical protein
MADPYLLAAHDRPGLVAGAADGGLAPSVLPLVMTLDGDDPSALEIILDRVRQGLDDAGAVLVRGDGGGSAQRLQAATARLGLCPIEYDERSTRRLSVGERVYGTTEHPSRLDLLAHNENAYAGSWPAVLALTCVLPARTGGQTPLYDVRKVLAAIDPAIVEEFCRREVLHVRNFGTGLGLGLEEAYGTRDRASIERTLAKTGARAEWRADGSLRVTWRTRPVLLHPRTGQACFFSHVAFFHQSSLPEELRGDLLDACGPLGLPNNTFYGDGGAIPDEVIAQVSAAYRRHEQVFDWRRGDLLFVDNMLCAHARRRFTGERQVLIALCDEIRRSEVRFV